ncbi:aminotransferase class V-fold PLP-dependent enzyme [Aeoliella sp. ICT_H6.2]|uniref:cysteine desulfurase n=1 Tax=Aeoliella straminimaris TaxID=2954799 RepID=A0A9X2F5Y0_9BACT|nr:aminotransferase class V-fold PLP-dependent enzyme [Aeoliella straminimaris]
MTVYLDDNATTRIDPRVLELMVRVMEHDYGNAGSSHAYGQRAKEIIHAARDQVGSVVAARRHEVVFTSGATESNNLAILGAAPYGLKTGKRHIISTQIEHKAVLEPVEVLRQRGFEITLLPPDGSGRVSSEQISDALRDDTLLVSVMHVNNETGVRQPIADIAERLASSDTLLHVDAAQGFGKVSQDLRHPRVDMISVSGHKVHGPQGIGALILRRKHNATPPLAPLLYGGGQELGFRPGTLPTALIAGFGLAAELAEQEAQQRRAHCLQISQLLREALGSLDTIILGSEADTVPNALNVSILDVSSDQAIEALQDLIAVSDGSACTTVCATPSHVLSAMGISAQVADCAIRMSWSHLTDVAALRAVLPQAIAQLHRLQNLNRGQSPARLSTDR